MPSLPQPPPTPRPPAGFSLIELLVVISIIAVMASLLAPALSGFAGGAGRKGAANIVMNGLEQARVAALESGVNAYFAIAPANFPKTDQRLNNFIILRDPKPEETNNSPIALTRWIKLPKGIYFDLSRMAGPSRSFSGLPGMGGASVSLPNIRFNSSGQLVNPATPNPKLGLVEGIFNNNAVFPKGGSTNGSLSTIGFARFTGRASFEGP